jgi:hypothetical protein
MTIQFTQIEPTRFSVSVDGTWIEGSYDSKESGAIAATLEPDALAVIWKGVLASGRDLLTVEDVANV